MSGEAKRRASFWPEPGSVTATSTEHSHKLPRALQLCLAALVLCVLALACAVGVLLAYILDVREYRNEQFKVMREQIRVSNCDLLDQLPEGGLLTRPREKYRCGPGIPLSEYPPDVRQQLEARPTSPPISVDPPRWPETGSPPDSP